MNRVLQHLGTRYPIVQSPMGFIARSQLASAVCRAGGLGVIETSSGQVDICKQEILKMKSLTDQPFGVNLPLMLLKDDTMVKFVAEQGVRFVTTSAGNPAKFIGLLKDAGITVYHATATLKGALKSVEAGVDGLIVEGNEGGGFKNPDPVSTLVLLQAIRQHSDIPMIAAGGIVDGRGMAAVFAAGAEGVQMGTRFVASVESPVHPNFKQAILDSSDTGTWVVNENTKRPMRALKTETTAKIRAAGEMPPEGMLDIEKVYFGGDMEASVAVVGQSVGLIDKVETAEVIIERTIEQFFEVQDQAAARAQSRSF
jgi:enoyl-[acyl-carrier protein] reductase II